MDESYECVGTSREEGGGEEERREKRETDPESKVGKKVAGGGRAVGLGSLFLAVQRCTS